MAELSSRAGRSSVASNEQASSSSSIAQPCSSGTAAALARTCCAAAKFSGRNRRANEQQLEADVTALALALRSCILWDYPMKDGAAAAERVAAALRETEAFGGAAVAAVDDTPVLLKSPDHAARPRAPAFVVLDGADAPRWAAPSEAAAYGAALQSAAEGIVHGPRCEDAALAAAGLSPSSLFGWLLDYPVCYAFADGDAAARALSGGDAVVFQLEADGGVAGHRFSVPAALVGPTLDAALARTLARLPKRAAPRYVQQPPVAGVVAF